ncbi:hypothetical protein GCM10010441_49060 [Kitasatospora paracochleata]|uniref:DUF4229 domain-containing protein n=1 Tax=Kitasatospora paracochleata TaxID=58354 RepID=A0ABT1IS41_9ACTN|nr:hypothetical protein [Kitasatospora paracochleata]MCP2307814.1 hypothetical protein [Kitasatospora paracochleata]
MRGAWALRGVLLVLAGTLGWILLLGGTVGSGGAALGIFAAGGWGLALVPIHTREAHARTGELRQGLGELRGHPLEREPDGG